MYNGTNNIRVDEIKKVGNHSTYRKQKNSLNAKF